MHPKYCNIKLEECVTGTCLRHQITPSLSNPVKMQQFLTASHGLSALPLSLFWGTGGHLPPLTSGPSEEALLSAPPLLLPVPVLDAIHLFRAGLQPPTRWQ